VRGPPARLSWKEAAREIDEIDRQRTSPIRDHFLIDPSDPQNHDLVLNFPRFTVEACAALVVDALHRRQNLCRARRPRGPFSGINRLMTGSANPDYSRGAMEVGEKVALQKRRADRVSVQGGVSFMEQVWSTQYPAEPKRFQESRKENARGPLRCWQSGGGKQTEVVIE
jgi:hypothetical protein